MCVRNRATVQGQSADKSTTPRFTKSCGFCLRRASQNSPQSRVATQQNSHYGHETRNIFSLPRTLPIFDNGSIYGFVPLGEACPLARRDGGSNRRVSSGDGVVEMSYTEIVGSRSYRFADLKTLMAKASPRRSGDQLAGVAAASEEEGAAAKMALAQVPLRTFLNEALIPYESDEVTRLVIDDHSPEAFA